MNELTLQRVALHESRTYGVLVTEDNVAVMATLEREWDGGSNRKSEGAKAGACIPTGRYWCKRVNSPKFGNTFEVTGVPNRSAILFHAGNIEDDSRGCILTGTSFDRVKGKDGVLASKLAFAEFLAMTKNVDGFWLNVKNPPE